MRTIATRLMFLLFLPALFSAANAATRVGEEALEPPPARLAITPGPVPEELVVSHAGLDWVWASPCNGGCSDPDPANQAGWRNATDLELQNAPSCDAFVRPDDSVRCASEYFDPTFTHCDLDDCVDGYVSGGSNFEAPYQMCINGTNNGNCESWFVRGELAPDEPVPTLSQWAIILLASAIAVLSVFRLRKRQQS